MSDWDDLAGLVPEVPTLTGQRCTLRALRPSDAPAMQRHADDPAVAYNLFDGFPQPYTLADAERWCGTQHREPGFAHVFGIVPGRGRAADQAADEIAGCISVTPQGGLWASSAVLGYWLGQAYWRRGITSEALSLVTAWAWATMPGITRLWMPIYARNLGSQAVARRAGYVLEGRMPLAIRKSGQAIDAVMFGCIRPGMRPSEGG
ncbi:MAG: GNAT family N-acetyltransferase [Rubrivivax sp.]